MTSMLTLFNFDPQCAISDVPEGLKTASKKMRVVFHDGRSEEYVTPPGFRYDVYHDMRLSGLGCVISWESNYGKLLLTVFDQNGKVLEYHQEL